ncbi:alpha/beta hydrolase [Pricia sp. S334]|uniref:Alpha/beta hydrolase n=1 Tax=Pricia mediterranea TaxID=3076079 RepID=A0ABU3L3G0_9FLAO|nr:alpha/beta hydrolase [Pricia sp. S334]MDT7828217.1 alpha/beta hydrolase [Pricia sp. S334]
MKISKLIQILLLLVVFVGCKTHNIRVQTQTEGRSVDQPKSVDIRGEDLHYIEQGSGEPLIFIHGTIGDYRAWISRMEPYSKNYHVVSYSRRYAWPNEQEFDSLVDYSVRIHADDLYALIQELGFEKVHLVGHSYGALTALTMTLDHPEVVQSLVLGEPPAASLVENSEKGQESFNAFMVNNLRPAADDFRADRNQEGLEHFVQGVMGADFRLAQVPPEGRQAWMDNLLELWGSAITESFLRLDPSRIKSLKVPVLLLVGNRSPQWLVEISRELDGLLPNSELVTLKNSSHGLYFENPGDADRAVMEFLEEH